MAAEREVEAQLIDAEIFADEPARFRLRVWRDIDDRVRLRALDRVEAREELGADLAVHAEAAPREEREREPGEHPRDDARPALHELRHDQARDRGDDER